VLGVSRPGEADAKGSPPGGRGFDAGEPGFSQRWVDVKVWDGGGDGFERRAEGMGQAHHGDVPVVGGELFAEGVGEANAVTFLEEGFEGPGHLDDDACAHLRELGSVANEVNGVADALLAVDEDGFAGDVGAADGRSTPLAGGIAADVALESFAVPAGFVIEPPFFVIAKGDEAHRPLSAGFAASGVDFENFFPEVGSFLESAGGFEAIRGAADGFAIDLADGVDVIEEDGESAIELVAAPEGEDEVVGDGVVGGVEVAGFLEGLGGFDELAAFAEARPEAVPVFGQIGAELDGAASGGDGLVVVFETLGGKAEVRPGIVIRGVDLGDGLEDADRFRHSLGVTETHAKAVEGRNVVGGGGENFSVEVFGLGEPARGAELLGILQGLGNAERRHGGIV